MAEIGRYTHKMNVEEILAEFYEAVDSSDCWEKLGDLLRKIRTHDSQVLYESFISVFTNESRSQSRFLDQSCASGMLWKLKPKCNIDIDNEIRSILSNYNLSIEELPCYCAEVYGLKEVRKIVKNLKKENFTG